MEQIKEQVIWNKKNLFLRFQGLITLVPANSKIVSIADVSRIGLSR